MDATRFDAIAKAIIPHTSRRRTLGGVFGGALVALGLTDRDDASAAKSGKCKQDCDECEFCRKGRCRKTKRGRKRCKKGKCKPVGNGTPCSVPANGTCTNGTCACPDETEECSGACVALCNAFQARNPDTCGCCFVNNVSCANNSDPRVPVTNVNCCSNVCSPLGDPPGGICAKGGQGAPCNVDDNCTSDICDDGRCD